MKDKFTSLSFEPSIELNLTFLDGVNALTLGFSSQVPLF